MFQTKSHNVASDSASARRGQTVSATHPALTGNRNNDSKLIAIVLAATSALALAVAGAVSGLYSLATPEQLSNISNFMGAYGPVL